MKQKIRLIIVTILLLLTLALIIGFYQVLKTEKDNPELARCGSALSTVSPASYYCR